MKLRVITGVLVVCLITTSLQARIISRFDSVRTLHYQPVGTDFVRVGGTHKFNRALYGSNTAFRVEAGDLPEFAMYLPGMGGNFRLAIFENGRAKWLTEADSIKTVYRPGAVLYEVRDRMLGNGLINLTLLALADEEGFVLKMRSQNIRRSIALMAVYGGVSGKKFSRNGDIGADPESSFYLLPEYCKGNEIELQQPAFSIAYNARKSGEQRRSVVSGLFPKSMRLHIGNGLLQDPLAIDSSLNREYPVVVGKEELLGNRELFFVLKNGELGQHLDASLLFQQAENKRRQLADRIVLKTPDPFINTLGGALSVAADAIWEDSSYLHGAVAWRMRLNAWRGAYVADPLGWHDRANKHFSSYAKSQVITPAFGPITPDIALHLARQAEKMGTSVFSSGYISRNPGGDLRPHHYDMNLVFIDQLLQHFKWSGDTAYVKQMWPLLVRHMAWEKRNFDSDNDGLYDAYACIWASDALQYSGGGVMHSSAYNYRANKHLAQLAGMIGEDGSVYEREAVKIKSAIGRNLWLPETGSYAEYKDLLGNQLVHPQAAAWTVYHAMDGEVPDNFQAWQLLQSASAQLPRIPILVNGLNDLHLTATSNWQPYTWSINNVALAENLHLALAYWQGGDNEEAYRLWRSAMIESMYLSASPGGFEQLSYYDAMRGELYRDFADPIGMAGRSLVEGLMGIQPDAMHDTLLVRPGFPSIWSHAYFKSPDVLFSFKRTGLEDQYTIKPSFRRRLCMKLELPMNKDVAAVLVNGKPVSWRTIDAIGNPLLQLNLEKNDQYLILIKWKKGAFIIGRDTMSVAQGDTLRFHSKMAVIIGVNDPQKILKDVVSDAQFLKGTVVAAPGIRTMFVQTKQGKATWWRPLTITVKEPIEIAVASNDSGSVLLDITNHSSGKKQGVLLVNPGDHEYQLPISLSGNTTQSFTVPKANVTWGTNIIQFINSTDTVGAKFVDWSQAVKDGEAEPIDISSSFNDRVSAIFKHRYLSPRPSGPTLQLPTQGIGNWCYPFVQPVIDDVGLRRKAGSRNVMNINGIPFTTPGDTGNNIIFTSKWDNFPDSISIPLSGHARHLYLVMAGSTNHMQSQLNNGTVTVTYDDGTVETLALKNPDTWWPIEQDYMEYGPAFHLNAPVPPRIHLKDGSVHLSLDNDQQYVTIKGFSNRVIEGGAATVLDLALDNSKKIKSMTVAAIANDVIIGLMSATLIR